jgi:hypothetical protein
MLNAPLWLMTVTDLDWLLVPTATDPKLVVAGENSSGGSVEPAIFTSWGLVAALSVIVMTPDVLPNKPEMKETLIVQLAPGTTVEQLFATE